MMGRAKRDKLTPELQERVVQAITCGATYELAALFARIRRETIWRWMKRGESQHNGKYREFCEAVKEAEGRTAVQALATIRSAAKDCWQASAWLLERRYGEQYGRQRLDVKTETKVEPARGPEPPLDLTKLSDEELRFLERIMARQEEATAASGTGDGAPGGAGAP